MRVAVGQSEMQMTMSMYEVQLIWTKSFYSSMSKSLKVQHNQMQLLHFSDSYQKVNKHAMERQNVLPFKISNFLVKAKVHWRDL